MKQTPLYHKHQEEGAKLVSFHGWSLPLQYRGILEEHRAVRQQAGLFDVSHMGALWVEGADALPNLQTLVTADLQPVRDGQVVYALLCDETGGTIDDLLLYRFSQDRWLLVVNASGAQTDQAWLQSRFKGRIRLSNRTEDRALLAVQGPQAMPLLQALTTTPLETIRFFRFVDGLELAGIPVLLSRTGYTGEDGFEVAVAAHQATDLWDQIRQAGVAAGLEPAGLGARDTLRFEAGLPLYGQELSRQISPLEAGLDRFVHLEKDAFIGREALIRQLETGVPRRRVGLALPKGGVPRAGYLVLSDDQPVGQVTSGTFSPTLGKNMAMALVTADQNAAQAQLAVVVRKKALAAQLVALPFYRRKKA